MPIAVRPVVAADLAELVRLLEALTPGADGDGDETVALAQRRINGTADDPSLRNFPCAVWVAQRKQGGLGGFIEVSLRSHAPGCSGGNPVGFIERCWVDPELREAGVGRALLARAAQWAKARGCTELAATVPIADAGSQRAAVALGFGEQDRHVAYRRQLD